MKLSIIIPVFNEENNVMPLFHEIVEVCGKLCMDYEIIFIDDGSTDNTFVELKKLRPSKIIRFRKNFGQTAALDAGIKAAAGDVIVTMDGDGQNNPADIPILLRELDRGYDAVSGWRWKRRDVASKRFISYGARILRRFIVGDRIHDSGCALKVYKKECFDGLDLHGEMHRFIPALLEWQGFTVTETKVNHRPRMSGSTKYTFSRTMKGFLDILSIWFWRKYSTRPLHLFGGVGLIMAIIGICLVLTLFFLRFFGIITLGNSIWPLASFFMILVGIQLLVSGFLADIALKNYHRSSGSRPYSISEVVINK